jgi:hypothetical protein
MNRRRVLFAAIVALLFALGAAQFWAMWRDNERRERHQIAHQEAIARWHALPKGPGQFPPPMPHYSQPPSTPPIFLIQLPVLLAATAAAVQEQRKRKEREDEEEVRTTYREDELMADWEFKIVRSPVGLFDRPKFLERDLAEEAAGGWRLVEKFDATRVRLKRPGCSIPGSATWPPGYDPFGTVVGPKACVHPVLWVVCALFGLMAIGMAILVAANDNPTARQNGAVVGAVSVVAAVVFAWIAIRAGATFRALAG